MAYISPKVQPRFDTLSDELKAAVLARDVSIHTLYDLIGVLEELVAEAEQ